MLIIVLSTLVVSLDNFSILTNLSGVLACFNNIGPGLELVGPSCNFAGLQRAFQAGPLRRYAGRPAGDFSHAGPAVPKHLVQAVKQNRFWIVHPALPVSR